MILNSYIVAESKIAQTISKQLHRRKFEIREQQKEEKPQKE